MTSADNSVKSVQDGDLRVGRIQVGLLDLLNCIHPVFGIPTKATYTKLNQISPGTSITFERNFADMLAFYPQLAKLVRTAYLLSGPLLNDNKLIMSPILI